MDKDYTDVGERRTLRDAVEAGGQAWQRKSRVDPEAMALNLGAGEGSVP